jgi:predicted DNA-binding transcriptional regulator YafY
MPLHPTQLATTSPQFMPNNQDTLFRHWHMLRLIPRYPSKITAGQVQHSLSSQGFEVSVRTLQRDLQELSQIFPLVVDEREKPFGWSWQRDARSLDLPGMTIPEALTWAMAEQHLNRLLPVSMMEHLQPHFLAARHRLNGEPQPKHGRAWLDKVRTVPPTQPLLPPQISEAVHREISNALLHEKQAEVRYRKKGETEAKTYRIHPLGLIQRGPVIYVYCRLFDYDDARLLALHRIEEATVLQQDAIYPDDFDLDDKAARGIWDFGTGENIQITLRFTPQAGEHLYETPLSADQVIEDKGDGFLTVSATVPDTPQLQWWILGFGDQVSIQNS